MMKYDNVVSDNRPAVVGVVIVLLVLFGLIGTCNRAPDVNTELARAARTAVESADDARRDSDAAYLWPGRLRMVAICLGVAVPVIAAVVLVWICLRHRPSDLDMIALLDEHRQAPEVRQTRGLPDSRLSSDLSLTQAPSARQLTRVHRRPRRHGRPKRPDK